MNAETLSSRVGTPSQRYKSLLRGEIQRFREAKGAAFTQSALAGAVGIEASYLSRVLNQSDQHPSRELLFRILAELDTPACRIQDCLAIYDVSQAMNVDYRRFLETGARIGRTRRAVLQLATTRGRVRRIAEALDEISAMAEDWEREEA
jgi:transcriptional regulator with XRE-family HTH domain